MKAFRFTYQALPANDDDVILLCKEWAEILAEEIPTIFWAQAFNLAIRNRRALSAAFQPAEVCFAWRQRGREWANAYVGSLPDSYFKNGNDIIPDTVTVENFEVTKGFATNWIIRLAVMPKIFIAKYCEERPTIQPDDLKELVEQIKSHNAMRILVNRKNLVDSFSPTEVA